MPIPSAMRHFRSLALFVLASATSACSSQAWYDGLQQSAQANCQKQPSGEIERCLEKLNRERYETYDKARNAR